MADVFERIATLRRDGQSFAVATVVGRRAPVSAHLGDRAIVFADGRMEGYVGGACSHEIIRRQALEAMQTRCSRLVSIRPDATASTESSAEHVVVPMTCVSEGAVDVYVEPFVQARRLVVVGATPVAAALARLARTMEYDVVRVVEAHERRDIEQETVAHGITVVDLDALETVLRDAGSNHATIVASQGHYDEPALTAILKNDVGYVGLVASRTRGDTLRAGLEESGVPGVATIRNPAGLDLGARTAPEVALSILAEIVQLQPSGSRVEVRASAAAPNSVTEAARHSPTSAVGSASARAVDPVCHMEVDVATAKHTADMDGVTYYFCCPNCRSRFVKQPQDYLGAHR
jgi:xanthine dehydrogenase accessory factor